jgi:hypothetical protein
MGKTYTFTENEDIRIILEKNLGFIFENGVGETNRLIERKEFVKAILDL